MHAPCLPWRRGHAFLVLGPGGGAEFEGTAAGRPGSMGDVRHRWLLCLGAFSFLALLLPWKSFRGASLRSLQKSLLRSFSPSSFLFFRELLLHPFSPSKLLPHRACMWRGNIPALEGWRLSQSDTKGKNPRPDSLASGKCAHVCTPCVLGGRTPIGCSFCRAQPFYRNLCHRNLCHRNLCLVRAHVCYMESFGKSIVDVCPTSAYLQDQQEKELASHEVHLSVCHDL